MPLRFSAEETLDLGQDTGIALDVTYDVPFPVTGKPGKVRLVLKQRERAPSARRPPQWLKLTM